MPKRGTKPLFLALEGTVHILCRLLTIICLELSTMTHTIGESAARHAALPTHYQDYVQGVSIGMAKTASKLRRAAVPPSNARRDRPR
jgi:hypothetical protein